jgi:sugar phosphate isomerase/epimerase
MVEAARKLGFSALELNVEIPESWMPQIEQSVAKGEIRISSLHDACPRIDPLPKGKSVFSAYQITADNEEERQQAVHYLQRTIRYAGRLGARAVVMHAGRVPTEPTGWDVYRYVFKFGRNGRLRTQLQDALWADRCAKAPKSVDILKRSLGECLGLAAENNVTIGLENRYAPDEVPSTEEAIELLATFKGGPLAYWHDTGHAEIFTRLGWAKQHQDFLEPFKGSVLGMHLHDVCGLEDHRAPGSGDLDFSLLKPYLTPSTIRVMEVHGKSNDKEVKQGIQHLRQAGIIQ